MLKHVIILLVLLCSTLSAASDRRFSNNYQLWLEGIRVSHDSLSDLDKLRLVDRQINLSGYSPDLQEQGVEDYWLTPMEFFQLERGDCEDFAIAKFFSLLAMGIDESHLQLVFGRLDNGQDHMLLAYRDEPLAEPLLLDNLTTSPTPASLRSDFQPVYSFNREGMWLVPSWSQLILTSSLLETDNWQRVLSYQQPPVLALR